MRGVDRFGAETAQILIALIIGEDDNEVRPVLSLSKRPVSAWLGTAACADENTQNQKGEGHQLGEHEGESIC